jgi:dihydrodipicolinate synthase/N-acetylneuraminate lyase
MNTISHDKISQSVIAVPPLARNEDLSLNSAQNRAIVKYLEAGGIKTILYGGNANFYHVRLSEYAELLGMLRDVANAQTWIIPAAGPAYGTMMDQAEILREFEFPTAMLLPHRELATHEGIMLGVRHFVEAANMPVVLYIKHDGWIDVPSVARLVDDGLVSMIKYAVVRDAPADDPFLRELVEHVDPAIIVSGIGEQPATIHLRDFGLAGFTSGCVCVAPAMSMRMLSALKAGDYEYAESIREQFLPLENLRNEINPIRVLHDAVQLAEIAQTGPVLPLLSGTSTEQGHRIKQAAVVLRQLEQATMV